jgi:DNA-binding PadR family transcriptional regulator
MYKQLMLLGLLLEKPMYGQQIREVIENHHDFLAEYIKKPTIYYQLERLVADGYLEIRREQVEAPGPGAAHEDMALRERDVYYITEHGRRYFAHLLRDTLGKYQPGLSEVEACLFFLHRLTPAEAIILLQERLQLVTTYHQQVERQELGPHDDAHQLVNEHRLMLLDAEIRWLQGAIARLQTKSVPRPH